MKKEIVLWLRWIVFGLYLFAGFIISFYANKLFSWNVAIFATAASIFSILMVGFSRKISSVPSQPDDKNQMGFDREKEIDASYNYHEVAIRSIQSLLSAHTEKDILEIALQSGVELAGANGASFIPYNEWGQSLPALINSKVPSPVLQSWAYSLASPEIRQVCKNCKVLQGSSNCVLLSADLSNQARVFCFPLLSSGREVGLINLYCTNGESVNELASKYFKEVLDAGGQLLKNFHIRDQEVAALLYLQTVNSPKSDLAISLKSLLENVQHALEVDFVLMYLPGGIPGSINSPSRFLSYVKADSENESSIPDFPFLEGIWKSVLSSGQSLSLENVVQNKHERWKVVLAVPLVWGSDEPVGVLVLGSCAIHAFPQRHQVLLETLAGQAALLIQNAHLMVQVEYQAVVDERTRLAREIHDGLAQTLAFLKIQAAQMQNFLERGETEKLTNTLQANYRTLSDAYIDARQAIDDLRRVPTSNLRDSISEVALVYEETTNQKVSIFVDEFSLEYPANIQAQLIRIVQEALNNVRKHAVASQVKIVGHQEGDMYMIEICDNGCGFKPTDVAPDGNSRYGLRGMRERSESIGADFQITSQPGMGTCVSVRVPMMVKEGL
ncbi:MAG: GAF domain-containing sensor histidine kinase [Chloroflexota bacterium]